METQKRKLHSPIHRSRGGLTLVEVMLASLVMILVFVSSVSALQIGFRILDDARMSTLANQIAQSKIENLRLLNWTSIQALQTSSGGTKDLLSPTNEITTILAGIVNTANLNRFTFFQLEILNAEDPDSTSTPKATRTNVKTLRVTIRWKGLRQEAHERIYETRYAQDGMFDYDYTAPPS